MSAWKQVWHSETNRAYYWNIETNETQWEMPTSLSEALYNPLNFELDRSTLQLQTYVNLEHIQHERNIQPQKKKPSKSQVKQFKKRKADKKERKLRRQFAWDSIQEPNQEEA